MIYGVFGLPGSGKSYYVIKEFILERISSSFVISNIKLSDNHSFDNYLYLDKFAMDEMNNNIKVIFEDDNTSHDDKKLLLKKLFLTYTKFECDLTLIVDEAHLYGYRGRSSTIEWADNFLSIHRHVFSDYFLDVVLITQVPSRLNKEIANQIEVSIKAVPSSQRLITSMLEYVIYGSVSSMIAKDSTMLMKRLVLKGKKSIFDVYQSGYVQKGSSDFRRKLGIIVIGLLLVGVFTYTRFANMLNIGNKVTTVGNKDKVSIISNNDKLSILSSDDIDNNNSEVDFKLVCRIVPMSFDTTSLVDYFFIYHRSKDIQICYKKFINKG